MWAAMQRTMALEQRSQLLQRTAINGEEDEEERMELNEINHSVPELDETQLHTCHNAHPTYIFCLQCFDASFLCNSNPLIAKSARNIYVLSIY